jgi:hypothetical protein
LLGDDEDCVADAAEEGEGGGKEGAAGAHAGLSKDAAKHTHGPSYLGTPGYHTGQPGNVPDCLDILLFNAIVLLARTRALWAQVLVRSFGTESLDLQKKCR